MGRVEEGHTISILSGRGGEEERKLPKEKFFLTEPHRLTRAREDDKEGGSFCEERVNDQGSPQREDEGFFLDDTEEKQTITKQLWYNWRSRSSPRTCPKERG